MVPTNVKFAGRGKPSKLELVAAMAAVVAMVFVPPVALTITMSVTVIVSLSIMSGNVSVSVTVMVSLSVTTAGDPVVPPVVPLRGSECAANPLAWIAAGILLVCALSTVVKRPDAGPVVVGVNVSVTTQLAPGASRFEYSTLVTGDGFDGHWLRFALKGPVTE